MAPFKRGLEQSRQLKIRALMLVESIPNEAQVVLLIWKWTDLQVALIHCEKDKQSNVNPNDSLRATTENSNEPKYANQTCAAHAE